jgi:hypothetical protein
MTGSGQTSSYILLISTSNCPSGSSCGGANAVDISGSGGAIAINAQKGTVNFSGSANAKEVTANQVILGGSTVINYETGLINPNFITGPFGSFSIDNWHELEQ